MVIEQYSFEIASQKQNTAMEYRKQKLTYTVLLTENS